MAESHKAAEGKEREEELNHNDDLYHMLSLIFTFHCFFVFFLHFAVFSCYLKLFLSFPVCTVCVPVYPVFRLLHATEIKLCGFE